MLNIAPHSRGLSLLPSPAKELSHGIVISEDSNVLVVFRALAAQIVASPSNRLANSRVELPRRRCFRPGGRAA